MTTILNPNLTAEGYSADNMLEYPWRQRLGTLFSVDPLTIDVISTPTSYSPGGVSTLFTFSRLGIDYINVIVFGGLSLSVTKQQSAIECAAYLSANAVAWATP